MRQQFRHTRTALDFVPYVPALALGLWLATGSLAGSTETQRWSVLLLQAWIVISLVGFGFLRHWPLTDARRIPPSDADRQVMPFGPGQ